MRSAAPIKKRVQGKSKRQAKKPAAPARDPQQDSEDIERAVYDGMQDLRVKKP